MPDLGLRTYVLSRVARVVTYNIYFVRQKNPKLTLLSRVAIDTVRRLANIKRNNDMLRSMGLLDSEVGAKKKKKKKKKRDKKPRGPPRVGARRSGRSNNKPMSGYCADDEEGEEEL